MKLQKKQFNFIKIVILPGKESLEMKFFVHPNNTFITLLSGFAFFISKHKLK